MCCDCAFYASNQSCALSAAWEEWAPLSRTLNRAQDVSAAEVAAFREGARRFAPALQAAFQGLSVTSKLHALTHHAPAFLRRFRSVGSYGEQALEA